MALKPPARAGGPCVTSIISSPGTAIARWDTRRDCAARRVVSIARRSSLGRGYGCGSRCGSSDSGIWGRDTVPNIPNPSTREKTAREIILDTIRSTAIARADYDARCAARRIVVIVLCTGLLSDVALAGAAGAELLHTATQARPMDDGLRRRVGAGSVDGPGGIPESASGEYQHAGWMAMNVVGISHGGVVACGVAGGRHDDAVGGAYLHYRACAQLDLGATEYRHSRRSHAGRWRNAETALLVPRTYRRHQARTSRRGQRTPEQWKKARSRAGSWLCASVRMTRHAPMAKRMTDGCAICARPRNVDARAAADGCGQDETGAGWARLRSAGATCVSAYDAQLPERICIVPDGPVERVAAETALRCTTRSMLIMRPLLGEGWQCWMGGRSSLTEHTERRYVPQSHPSAPVFFSLPIHPLRLAPSRPERACVAQFLICAFSRLALSLDA
ncbi:hypothetical protein BJ912DRAFT_1065535 [Pholiota molesta]|nr:hypothetical protein BJ912DRAFT_1065535 [Pholiota molesta]